MPLNTLLKTTSANSQTVQCNPAATTSFLAIKDALANAALLVRHKPGAPSNMMTDASDIAIGAVLQQHLDDTWYPFSQFSRKLTPTEQ